MHDFHKDCSSTFESSRRREGQFFRREKFIDPRLTRQEVSPLKKRHIYAIKSLTDKTMLLFLKFLNITNGFHMCYALIAKMFTTITGLQSCKIVDNL